MGREPNTHCSDDKYTNNYCREHKAGYIRYKLDTNIKVFEK